MDKIACDLLVIGGGINGTAIAADAAGRGLTVVLCDKNDLASATSSASSKLIHGGLRYLAQGEFGLVRQALQERRILLQRAPHLVKSTQFILPYAAHLRPAWMIRFGLFLYDHLDWRSGFPRSTQIDLRQHPAGAVLKKHYHSGFCYSDGIAHDARLVVANALAAAQQGAKILNYTELLHAKRGRYEWQASLLDKTTQQQVDLTARVIINAAGPFTEEVLQRCLQVQASKRLALVKGSHIVVPKLYQHEYAYLLQNPDQRVVFVVPYGDYSLIGTTEIPFQGDPAAAVATEQEQDYLCESVNAYFSQRLLRQDIIGCYAGVRPLLQDGAAALNKITRDYAFELVAEDERTPCLTVFGGKLTTHRSLAERAVTQLKRYFPQCGKAWTAQVPLPGGEMPQHHFAEFCQTLTQNYPGLPEPLLRRYASQYGTRTYLMLGAATTVVDLGKDYGHGLYQQEVDYLKQYEWAKTLEDILWRRTQLGWKFTQTQTSVC